MTHGTQSKQPISRAEIKRRKRLKRDLGPVDPFVKLELWMIRSPIYRSLSCVARAVLIELRALYNGTNNGRLILSAREAGRLCKVSKDTAARALKELIAKGFIEVTTPSSFNRKTRDAAEYALTWERNDVTGALPSKAFMKPARQIQNTVALQGRHGPTTGTANTHEATKFH